MLYSYRCNLIMNKYKMTAVQDSANFDETVEKLKEHLESESIGCSAPDTLSTIIAKDALTWKFGLFQKLIDLYYLHKYKHKSFDEFMNNTPFSDLHSNDLQILNSIKDYHHHYNKDICAPFHEYLAIKQQSFEGNPNTILEQIAEGFTHCNTRATRLNHDCCQQIDIFYKLQSKKYVRNIS